jgi:hypothetical protein
MALAAGIKSVHKSGVPMLFRSLIVRVLALLVITPVLAALAQPKVAAKPYNPPIAPASDEGVRAMKNFAAPEGFVFELFAAEPRLANPVAFYVDHQGNLWRRPTGTTRVWETCGGTANGWWTIWRRGRLRTAWL